MLHLKPAQSTCHQPSPFLSPAQSFFSPWKACGQVHRHFSRPFTKRAPSAGSAAVAGRSRAAPAAPPPSTMAAAAAEPAAAEPGHYDSVAAAYEKAFFYSSLEYRDWVLSHLLRHMGLPSQDADIVDIGGGTGNFTQALAEAAGTAMRALCVDPFPEMLAQAVRHPRVEPLLMDAVGFAQLPPGEMRYSHALFKEVVHHIPDDQVPALFAGVAAQLRPGGVAVVVTRPQEVDYPLFERARQIWREHQPHHSVYTTAMEAAGLEVEVAAHEFHATLPLATWLGMMRDKFWSTFSHCTTQELEQGIAEVAEQHSGKDSVQFVDRLLFLVARKTHGEEGAAAAAAAAAAEARADAENKVAAGDAAESGEAAGAQSNAGQAAAAAAGTAGAAPAFTQLPLGMLSVQQREQYQQDGFTGPVSIMSEEEAGELLSLFQEYEAARGGKVEGDWRFKAHLLLPWLWDLARHPRVVAAASEALGGCRNVLCWSTDIFVKEPGDGAYTSWHQDSTYVALDPPDVVTAWFALTPSGPENGCLHFLPGSHHSQLPHVDTYSEGNLLLKGQTIVELEERGEQGVAVPLRPGQISLHHICLAHRSGPAAVDAGRRVGIAIRYMAAHVDQQLDPRDSVTLVAGRDTFGMYRHEEPPAAPLDAAALEEHQRAVGRVFPDGYARV